MRRRQSRREVGAHLERRLGGKLPVAVEGRRFVANTSLAKLQSSAKVVAT
jgi:hypothetical protein